MLLSNMHQLVMQRAAASLSEEDPRAKGERSRVDRFGGACGTISGDQTRRADIGSNPRRPPCRVRKRRAHTRHKRVEQRLGQWLSLVLRECLTAIRAGIGSAVRAARRDRTLCGRRSRSAAGHTRPHESRDTGGCTVGAVLTAGERRLVLALGTRLGSN